MIERAEELGKREEYLMSLIEGVEEINKELARLKLIKENLEKDIISAIDHHYEGSKTYVVGDRAVTIKTDLIYMLDKKAYISGECYLPAEFDPVLQKVTYEVNKTLFKSYKQYAPLHVRETLDKLVERKQSKPNVSIKVRS